MLLHQTQRLVSIPDRFHIAMGTRQRPQMAETHYFVVVYDQDLCFRVHVTTSRMFCCPTFNEARAMPALRRRRQQPVASMAYAIKGAAWACPSISPGCVLSIF